MLLCCRIMVSFGSVDTKGGYHMGKDGIVPANDAIYDNVSDLNSTEILRNEMWKVGNEKIFYTPEMQRDLQDQIIAKGDIAWPPPGIYLPQVEDPIENNPENSHVNNLPIENLNANNSPAANFQFENFRSDDFQFNFDGDDFQCDNFQADNF
ncbi:hypothetical protein ACFX15_013028 [Malus domestica]